MFDSVLSAGLGFIGQERANQTNVRLAREANALSQSQARESMAFEKEMSNTAHQRQMADLKKAGLNPLLSGTGGASTPGGSQGSVQGASVENSIGKGLTSALEVKSMQLGMEKQKQEINLMKSQEHKSNTEAKVLEKGIPRSEIINDAYDVVKPYVRKLKKALTPNARSNFTNQPFND